MNDKNVIIFGAGRNAIKTYESLKKNGFNILFFIDNKPSCVEIYNRPIITFESYLKMAVSATIVISVTTDARFEIENMLIANRINNFIHFSDYKIQKQYTYKSKLAIWGWWQGNNMGDNWIKLTHKHFFPQADFIDTTITDFSNYNFVLIGGGGLFINSIISPWNTFPDIHYGAIGISAEFKHNDNQAEQLRKQSKFFFVRDDLSIELMKLNNVTRSYDVTFAYPLEFLLTPLNMNNVQFIWYENDLLDNSLYSVHTCNQNSYLEILNILYQIFDYVDFSDFQGDSGNPNDYISNNSGIIVSGKFHGIVAAIQKGIPCIGIEMSVKVRSIMNDCGLDEYCITKSEISKIPHLVNKIKKNYNIIRQKQFDYRNKAYQKMSQDYEYAITIINKYI